MSSARALQTGQDPNNITDMDSVWVKVRETRDLAKKFWSSGAESQQLMVDGEVSVGAIWHTRAKLLSEDVMLGAVVFGHQQMQLAIDTINTFTDAA